MRDLDVDELEQVAGASHKMSKYEKKAYKDSKKADKKAEKDSKKHAKKYEDDYC